MKNLHIIAFTTPQNHDIQIGTFLNENLLTSVNIGQGVKVLSTLVLDGTKLLNELSPAFIVQPPVEANVQGLTKQIDESFEKHKEQKENEQAMLERMVVGTKYLAEKYGTKLEQKHINNLIKKVYETNPTITG